MSNNEEAITFPSSQLAALFVTAGTSLGCNQLALLHIETLSGFDLPFVESGAAQGDAFGFALALFAAGGVEIDDFAHGE